MTMPNNLTSVRGRNLGFDSSGVLNSRIGVRAGAIFHDLNAGTTAATISNGGVTTIASTGVTALTMAAPQAGVDKFIAFITTSATTHARSVALASGTLQSTSSSTYTTITWTADGGSAHLIGLSTSRFMVISNNGGVLS
jgi:hypothetical protein